MSIQGYDYFNHVAQKWAIAEYQNVDLNSQYPANQFRLDIFKNLINEKRPSRLLDIGCGGGDPLKEFLKIGIDAHGFDYAQNMVDLAKNEIARAGFDPDRVSRNNMEDPEGIDNESFDCLVALGSLYYANSFSTALTSMTTLLKPGGRFIFSLRNELFSLFSQNKYTADFMLKSLINTSALTHSLSHLLQTDLSFYDKNLVLERKFETIDDLNVHTSFHNPLTIASQLKGFGLEVRGIYFYHFHALPPKYEHIDPITFRTASLAIEKPNDWRGHFQASCFIVDTFKT